VPQVPVPWAQAGKNQTNSCSLTTQWSRLRSVTDSEELESVRVLPVLLLAFEHEAVISGSQTHTHHHCMVRIRSGLAHLLAVDQHAWALRPTHTAAKTVSLVASVKRSEQSNA